LDLTLFVDRQHHGMARRRHVETDNGRELGDEVGVTALLEAAQAVRLQLVRRPDPLHRAQRDPDGLGHHSPRPVRGHPRGLATGQGHDALRHGLAERRLAGLAGLVAQQPVEPGLGVAPLPAPYRRPADPGPPSHRRDVEPLGREQHDPGASDVLLRPIAIADDHRQPQAILGRDQGANRLCHEQAIAQIPPPVNPKIASVH
jgi:hypothetical protein